MQADSQHTTQVVLWLAPQHTVQVAKLAVGLPGAGVGTGMRRTSHPRCLPYSHQPVLYNLPITKCLVT
jgi:hypothetical protein